MNERSRRRRPALHPPPARHVSGRRGRSRLSRRSPVPGLNAESVCSRRVRTMLLAVLLRVLPTRRDRLIIELPSVEGRTQPEIAPEVEVSQVQCRVCSTRTLRHAPGRHGRSPMPVPTSPQPAGQRVGCEVDGGAARRPHPPPLPSASRAAPPRRCGVGSSPAPAAPGRHRGWEGRAPARAGQGGRPRWCGMTYAYPPSCRRQTPSGRTTLEAVDRLDDVGGGDLAH